MTRMHARMTLGALAILAAVWFTSSPAATQAPGARATIPAGSSVPRTPWGDPDLQGTWTSEAELSVPFERSREFGNRETLTDQEFAAREAQTQKQLDSDNSDFDLETADRSTAGQVGSATSPPPNRRREKAAPMTVRHVSPIVKTRRDTLGRCMVSSSSEATRCREIRPFARVVRAG